MVLFQWSAEATVTGRQANDVDSVPVYAFWSVEERSQARCVNGKADCVARVTKRLSIPSLHSARPS